MSLSQEVGKFVAGIKFDDLPEKVVEKAKLHIMDTLGVLIAAVDDPIMNVIKEYLKEAGRDSCCTILGTGIKTSPETAALASGIMAHGLDFDDASWRMIGHPSAVVVPAVMALGEAWNITGKDFITAYVLGTEVACKIGYAAEPELYEAGWHATGVVGVLGAAAACGYLLKLNEQQLSSALGIAASLAAGLRQNFGSMTKPFHAGAAARNGVTAALLARHGFTSSIKSLDGKGGFFANFTGGKKEGNFPSPGDTYDIESPGFFIKPYPSCAATHTGIDAMLSLVEEYGFTDDQVESIDVGSGPVGPVMLFHKQPCCGAEGKFSMYYVMAIAIMDRKVGLDAFRDGRVHDPRVASLINKTSFHVEPEFSCRSIDGSPAVVRVRLKDGRELIRKVEKPLGSPDNPMTKAQQVDKYKDCTLRVLPEHKVERSLSMFEILENLTDFKKLINVLIP